MTPLSLRIRDTSLANSKFCGYGIPCATIVDSRATTGFPEDKACSTSGKRRMHDSESLRFCVVENTEEDLRTDWNANNSVDVMVATNLFPG
mmetsp:Transcript_5219/g.10685  ORF Transcript_5219/g.10685 Transcript_5219/m.10685 type:complete len:91 (-) Transcript_5219:66-338(-)